jgi:hypothetical protein
VKETIFVGYDPREQTAYEIAVQSVSRRLSRFIPIHGLVLDDLVGRGLYTRPTTRHFTGASLTTVMWDKISDAPMSTEHANARFLTKHLAGSGWALFMDGDMLARADIAQVFDGLDPAKAVYCVQHHHEPPAGLEKMDGQIQTAYARKNWSSFMLINCDHRSNRELTIELINALPGRDLHRFCWLADDEIGALDPKWNYLVGASPPLPDVAVAHFTLGLPDMPGYEECEFADEWWAERRRLAA